MEGTLQELLTDLKEALSRVYGENLRGLYLYGSYARREEDSESDLDVAVILGDFEDYWREIQRTSQIISELSLKYNVTISPVRVRERKWGSGDSPFFRNARREGIAV